MREPSCSTLAVATALVWCSASPPRSDLFGDSATSEAELPAVSESTASAMPGTGPGEPGDETAVSGPGLVWGGCNLEHVGYAIFNAAFGSAHWGRWSSNPTYGPQGAAVRCFGEEDIAEQEDASLQHYVR